MGQERLLYFGLKTHGSYVYLKIIRMNKTCKKPTFVGHRACFCNLSKSQWKNTIGFFQRTLGDFNFIVGIQKYIIPAVLYEITSCLSKVLNYFYFLWSFQQIRVLVHVVLLFFRFSVSATAVFGAVCSSQPRSSNFCTIWFFETWYMLQCSFKSSL